MKKSVITVIASIVLFLVSVSCNNNKKNIVYNKIMISPA